MKKADFFVSAPLGFEAEAAQEIKEVWGGLLDLDGRPHGEPLLNLQVVKGGVEFQAPFHLGLQLNFFLRICHRVLVRMRNFRCRDFPKLFSEFKKMELSQFVEISHLQIQVAASQSRLNNEKRIEQTVREALKVPVSAAGPQTLFIRLFDDQCTVSLDSSGEHLHFRTGAFLKGAAPLRETTAAYLLRQMMGSASAAELAQVEWVDPMMGSGTFLLELALWNSANGFRTFAFQEWKNTPKILKTAAWINNYPFPSPVYKSLRGFDRDAAVVKVAQKNFAAISVQAQCEVTDLNDLLWPVSVGGKRWVIINPPYGARLEADLTPEGLLRSVAERISPEKIGVLFSNKQAQALRRNELRLPGRTLKRIQSQVINNGGLMCEFQIWECICTA